MERERPANEVVDAALDWLDGVGKGPFFCWVHLYDPHAPYEPPAPYAGRFGANPYDGEIAFVDSQIGRLLDGLDTRGLRDGTLIVAAGDHGEGLGDHDEKDHAVFVYETTMRVPLIFSLPGRIAGGLRVAAAVGLVDLFPTLAEVAGISAPEDLSGRSLVPALRGKGIAAHDQYGESDYPFEYYGWSPLRSVTTARWKYVRAPKEELYDRRADPGERNNLARREEASLAQMQRRLAALENAMRSRGKTGGALSEEQRRGLEALGYMTGRSGREAPRDIASLEDPKNMTGVLNRWLEAIDLLREQKTDEAIAVMKPLAAELPDYVQLQSTLAGVLARQGDSAGAIRHFRLALDAHKKSGTPDGPAVALLHNSLGGLLARSGRRREAIPQFERAVKIRSDYSEAFNNLGSALAQEGKLERAIACFHSALDAEPHNAGARGNLGSALFLQGINRVAGGDYEKGLGLLREGLSCRPEDPRIADALARILASCPVERLRDAGGAIRLAEKTVARDRRKNPLFLDTLAIAYANGGRFEDAIAAARAALAIARRVGDARLIADIEKQIALFEAKQPFRGSR